MHEQVVSDATIDVCDGCGAVWIDAADGDVAGLAAAARVGDGDAEAGAGGSGCPRCERSLEDERIRGVLLPWCTSCGGRFVPRASLDGAIWLTPEDFARQPRLGEAVGAWIRWLGGSRRSP